MRLVFVIASLVLPAILAPTSAFAQEKHAFQYSTPPQTSRYVKDVSIDVDDTPGHRVRIVEIQRVYGDDAPEILGVKLKESWIRALTDYVDGVGPNWGYDTWILADGNKIFFEFDAVTSSQATATGSRRGSSNSTSKIIGGTGKFANLRGTIAASVEFDTDKEKGYSRPTLQGQYWLAQ